MKEYGILYTQENIRNLAAKRKWQTRRVIVPQPPVDWIIPRIVDEECWELGHWDYNPSQSRNIWQPNSRYKLRYPVDTVLYVKEAWWYCCEGCKKVFYKAKDPDLFGHKTLRIGGREYAVQNNKWKSPMFMPKWAARPELKRRVTEVRVQRIQDISEEDAIAEGIEYNSRLDPIGPCKWRVYGKESTGTSCPVHSFQTLWDSINAKPKPVRQKKVITHYVSYPWDNIHETRELRGKPWYVCGNPFVFAYSFEEL